MRGKVNVLVYRKIAVSTKGRLRPSFLDKIKEYLLEKNLLKNESAKSFANSGDADCLYQGRIYESNDHLC